MQNQYSSDAGPADLPTTRALLGLILCFAAMMADGFDLAVMPLSMPAIAREWQLTETRSFGTIFSAGLVGIMVGAPLLGSIADRAGRKRMFVASLVFLGLCTLLTTQVHTVSQLVAIRFGTGVGIGGALPLGIVISTELARPELRARVVAIVSTGATTGAALCGFVGSWLLPSFDWQSMFLVGGIGPIAIAGLAIFLLPKSSPRSHATKPPQAETWDDTMTSPRSFELFRGSLAVGTPLLWTLFGIIGLTIYFLQSWSPILFSARGYTTADVAIALGLFGGFGAVGGLLIGWPVDWFGIRPVMVLFLLAVPVLAALALMPGSQMLLWALMAAVGLLFFSAQVAVNSIATQVYPVRIRAKGVGWGLGSVRLGQLLGAYGGGLLISAGLNMSTLFWLLAGFAGIGLAASALLSRKGAS